MWKDYDLNDKEYATGSFDQKTKEIALQHGQALRRNAAHIEKNFYGIAQDRGVDQWAAREAKALFHLGRWTESGELLKEIADWCRH